MSNTTTATPMTASAASVASAASAASVASAASAASVALHSGIRIIALCGNKHAGKDVIADHLVANHSFQKMSIAHPLKTFCRDAFGLTDTDVFGPDKDKPHPDLEGKTPRMVLQFVGTELMQHNLAEFMPSSNRLIWIRLAVRKILESHQAAAAAAAESKTRIVIADVRFVHEVRVLREAFPASGALEIWRVLRPSLVSDDMHESERNVDAILDIDRRIVNCAGIKDLTDKADEALFLPALPSLSMSPL